MNDVASGNDYTFYICKDTSLLDNGTEKNDIFSDNGVCWFAQSESTGFSLFGFGGSPEGYTCDSTINQQTSSTNNIKYIKTGKAIYSVTYKASKDNSGIYMYAEVVPTQYRYDGIFGSTIGASGNGTPVSLDTCRTSATPFGARDMDSRSVSIDGKPGRVYMYRFVDMNYAYKDGIAGDVVYKGSDMTGKMITFKYTKSEYIDSVDKTGVPRFTKQKFTSKDTITFTCDEKDGKNGMSEETFRMIGMPIFTMEFIGLIAIGAIAIMLIGLFKK
jgi:hypothetical protein